MQVANLGLVLFLFLVGLELDIGAVRRGAQQAFLTSAAGIIVPFLCSVPVSYILHSQMGDKAPPFMSFLLFLGVAMSITAFPVLARILTERKLLRSHVGRITISAAAVDDSCAWCLLALVMSIVNSGTNYLTALYVFLCTLAYAAFLFIVVRPLLNALIRRTETSFTVSEFAVFLTFMMVLSSAFITEAIGIHAIFGAFLIGVIIPHESGFAIKLTEKIEDFVTIVCLPLYFASSGLKTEIGLLNDGR
jgi:Kef-type K+ transport system membrane component KefB